MRQSSANLIVFAKWPRPGRTKTQLIPAVGPERAAAIQRSMTGRTLLTCRIASAGHPIGIGVCFSEGRQCQMRGWLGRGLDYVRQPDPHLGRRLTGIFGTTLTDPGRRTIVVGTDCPGLTADIIHTAFDALGSHDLVLGPATDGSYYLVGLSRPSPDLFANIPWGTDAVLRETLSRAETLGMSIHWLPPLTDVDVPADLWTWEALRTTTRKGEAINRISVIIPTLNEAAHVAGAVTSARSTAGEVIVVDGGSIDATVEVARAAGAAVIQAPRGRARQMNAGARAARGGILLFLHADCQLPTECSSLIQEALESPHVVAGAFRLAVDADGALVRAAESAANWRSRVSQAPRGNQGIFMRADTFEAVGGYADMPVLEDYDLVRRLRGRGRVVTIAPSLLASSRHWRAHGTGRGMLRRAALTLGCRLGVSDERLIRMAGFPTDV